jgi:hypothetical protein
MQSLCQTNPKGQLYGNEQGDRGIAILIRESVLSYVRSSFGGVSQFRQMTPHRPFRNTSTAIEYGLSARSRRTEMALKDTTYTSRGTCGIRFFRSSDASASARTGGDENALLPVGKGPVTRFCAPRKYRKHLEDCC